MIKCLMMGAGHSPLVRKMTYPGARPLHEIEWTSLDMNPRAKPDIVFNLNDLHFEGRLIPVADETFDEVHAYEVLEHVGQLGNYIGYFREFREYWRILKPGGWLIGTCPAPQGGWEFGDPGHTRIISHQSLSYLTKGSYEKLGENTGSDYRSLVEPCWWSLEHSNIPKECPSEYVFGLRKVKDGAAA